MSPSVPKSKPSSEAAVSVAPNWSGGTMAVLIGLAGVLFIPFFTHWYEVIIFGDRMPQVIVNALTPVVFALFLILVTTVNPLLRRFFPRMEISTRHLFLLLSVWLLTGAICYSNMVAPVLASCGKTYNEASEPPLAKRVQFHSQLRPGMFLSKEEARDYWYGTSGANQRISFSAVPWQAWSRPLMFWVPFMVGMVIFSSSLVRMVHNQWSRHELLTYPLADFTRILLEPIRGKALPKIMHDKIFWIGFIFISIIYTINGLQLWFPLMIKIPLSFQHMDLIQHFTFLSRYCGTEAYSLFRGFLYPSVVCIAVLLPMEISLTCWLGWVLMVFGTGFYFLFTGEVIGPSETNFMQYGMYVTMVAVILMIGRREYLSILRGALRPSLPADETLRRAVVSCRVFLVSFAALTMMLMFAGLNGWVALVLVASFSLLVILAARMTAEAGIPWLVSLSSAGSALPLKLLGAAAIGPKGLAILAVVGAMMDFDMSNSVAAQETTCSKLRETTAPSKSRGMNLFLLLGLCVALAASVTACLWDNYSFGARLEERTSVRNQIESASSEINRLQAEGLTGTGAKVGLLAQIAAIQPEKKFVKFFLYGAVLVAGCAALRIRFTGWPFHPLPLLLLGTWCLSRLFFSFFVGWLIKVALVKIGGGKVFSNSKPFFMGVIAGQIAIASFWVAINAIYYLHTGTPPPPIRFIF